ncbi:MAG: hypothetical protein E4H07_04000 [Nitrosomonadales bacterium]|nr:MAG: hypothetical protein E4H07_04000 [Nitrosomonadales bacterium]
MASSVFEGERMISKLITSIWIVLSGISRWGDVPIVFASYVIGGSLFILAFTWTIGWIVRGFNGIPKGQDKKRMNLTT